MRLWDRWKSLLLQASPAAPSAQRLDGRSKVLLGASIKALPYETLGWITNKEGKQLFSSMDDDYAFGEMDEAGKDNIRRLPAAVLVRVHAGRSAGVLQPESGRRRWLKLTDHARNSVWPSRERT
jgi:hypothetical protein